MARMILNHYIMWPRRIATCFCIMIQWVSTMTATKDATRVRATLDIAYLHRAAGGRGGGGCWAAEALAAAGLRTTHGSTPSLIGPRHDLKAVICILRGTTPAAARWQSSPSP